MKYVTYDFEGELVCKDGKPVIHNSYDKADAAKGMGVVADYEEESDIAVFEEPLPEVYTRTQDYFVRLRTIAEEQVPATVKEGTIGYNAHVAFNILSETEVDRRSIKAIQLAVLIEVARDDLYTVHPGTPDFPNGFNDLKQFMRAAGVTGGGQFYEMAKFASDVAPKLEAGGVDYTNQLSSTHVAKTLEATPLMRRKLEAGESVTDILDRVLELTGKRGATAEFRSRREGERYGDGCVNHVDNITIVTIITPDAEQIVKALTGVVTFDKLIATVDIKGRLIEVTTSRP